MYTSAPTSNFLSVFICSQFLDNLSPLSLNIHKNLRYQRIFEIFRDFQDFEDFLGFLQECTRFFERIAPQY